MAIYIVVDYGRRIVTSEYFDDVKKAEDFAYKYGEATVVQLFKH
jgi:hypothetical protein